MTLPNTRFHRFPTLLTAVLLAPLAVASSPAPARAQEENPDRRRWVFEGEVTTVFSRGNSETITLGLGAAARRRWQRDALKFEAGAIRVETGTITRRAVGTTTDYAVEKNVDRKKTAEALFVRGRYDRTISEKGFLFGGADLLRNTFSGIDSRFLLALGGGNKLADSDQTRLSTSYALTYTFQDDVVKNPFLDADFVGMRLGWEFWRQVSGSATLESTFVGDLNLKETDDRRFDLVSSMTVDINETLALKPSLQLVWRNLPSLTQVPLVLSDGTPTGTSVQTPLDKVDTFFKLAFVLSF